MQINEGKRLRDECCYTLYIMPVYRSLYLNVRYHRVSEVIPQLGMVTRVSSSYLTISSHLAECDNKQSFANVEYPINRDSCAY